MIIQVCFVSTNLFPALPAPSLISSNYGGICTSQNGGDKAHPDPGMALQRPERPLGGSVTRAVLGYGQGSP